MWYERSGSVMVTTRDFSRRYVLMKAPLTVPSLAKCSRIIFPKREELLLRTVLALPNDSSSGLVERIASASLSSLSAAPPLMAVDSDRH